MRPRAPGAIVPPVVDLFVTWHAAKRFVERGGETSVVRAEVELLKMAERGKRVVSVPRCAPKARGATYYRSGDWILVIAKNSLVTVFRADGQWKWTA